MPWAGAAWLAAALACALGVLAPRPARAVSVLLYYSTTDGFNSAKMPKLRNLLQAKYGAGNVTVINVGTTLYDPSADNWGLYDQVWDLRYREANTTCPYTYAAADWDYFSAAWQAKAGAYLRNCGSFFVWGENGGFPAKSAGVAAFLNAIGATNAMGTCNGVTGNNYDSDPVNLPSTLPGSTFLHTWAYGGIPLSRLNGTSFAEGAFVAPGVGVADGVTRAVAAGWSGASQMALLGGDPAFAGRLFTVWDQSMWQWGDYEGNAAARALTDSFFTAVADWFEAAACVPPTPTATPTASPTASPTPTATPAMPLVKSSSAGQATIGDTLTFTLAWANDSSATVTMNLSDDLGPILTPLGCDNGCSILGSQVSWSFSAVPGSSGAVQVWARVDGYP